MGELASHRRFMYLKKTQEGTGRSQAHNNYYIWSTFLPIFANQLTSFWNFCTVRSIVRFGWYFRVGSIYIVFDRLDWYLCKFDLDVCGSIYFCTVRLIFVEVRFICMQFDLFLYGSIYFLLFWY